MFDVFEEFFIEKYVYKQFYLAICCSLECLDIFNNFSYPIIQFITVRIHASIFNVRSTNQMSHIDAVAVTICRVTTDLKKQHLYFQKISFFLHLR